MICQNKCHIETLRRFLLKYMPICRLKNQKYVINFLFYFQSRNCTACNHYHVLHMREILGYIWTNCRFFSYFPLYSFSLECKEFLFMKILDGKSMAMIIKMIPTNQKQSHTFFDFRSIITNQFFRQILTVFNKKRRHHIINARSWHFSFVLFNVFKC